MVKCKSCGFKTNDAVKVDGEWYCWDCASGKFYLCYDCHKYCHEDDLQVVYIDENYDEEEVCPDCLSKYYVKCEVCNEYFDKKAFEYNENEKFVCPDCREEG